MPAQPSPVCAFAAPFALVTVTPILTLTLALALALASAAATAQQPAEASADKQARVLLGSGAHSYEWVPGWGKLPDGQGLGNTHGGMAVDKQGRIYFSTDSERAVCIFEPDGKFVGAWGENWKDGLHGLMIREEEGEEFIYFAHFNRGEVAKATLDGEILWTLGYPKESGLYENGEGYKPTGVTVGPNDHLYVVDGYGKSYVHEWDGELKYVRSWGGPGTEPGKMNSPHGIWLDTRTEPARLLVADRENHRVQAFSLDGKLLQVIEGPFRRPCSFCQSGKDLVVPDLLGRVTILDEKNEVVAQLGDNPDEGKRAQNGVPPDQWRDGEFIAPHSACCDRDGNLYVMDWNRFGRVNKLRRVAPKH